MGRSMLRVNFYVVESRAVDIRMDGESINKESERSIAKRTNRANVQRGKKVVCRSEKSMRGVVCRNKDGKTFTSSSLPLPRLCTCAIQCRTIRHCFDSSFLSCNLTQVGYDSSSQKTCFRNHGLCGRIETSRMRHIERSEKYIMSIC